MINISRSKGNQTVKFSQLIEYNMRTTFLQKSNTDLVEKLVSDPFSKTSKLCVHISRSSFIRFVFIVFQAEDYRNILKLSCRPLQITAAVM